MSVIKRSIFLVAILVLVTSSIVVQEALAVTDFADLSISKSDSVDPVSPDELFSYTITVSNAGPADADNVVVLDNLPIGITFISTSGCLNDPGGVPSCSLGTVLAGDSKTYTITVKGISGIHINYASVSSTNTDPNVGNNEANEETTIQNQPTLVGGEMIPLDTTVLLLAGVQGNAIWLIPIVSVIGIGIFIIRRQ